jgi:aspartyl-tRNA(Asn)/glutamyl-tRNA(Gln) amidotransferase subunit C
MLEIKDIEKLAKLARIQLDEEEKNRLLKEIDPILGYVAQIQEVSSKGDSTKKAGEIKNIMREDEVLNGTGQFTDALVADMPESEDGFLKVKKIL